MHNWSLWALYYAVPAAIGSAAAYGKSALKRLLLIHAALLVSILLITSTGTHLEPNLDPYAGALLAAATAAAGLLLGWKGLAYALSSVVQETSMLLAAALIGRTAPGVALTALLYSLAHLISPEKWKATLPITLAWGVCSILLYFSFHQPALNMAAHLIGGVMLIRSRVI